MARPILAANRRESLLSLLIGITLLVGSALAILIWQLPVILVLCTAGFIGAVSSWAQTARKAPAPHA
jgi:hypothetical protein